jgi:hypothetical protein
MFFVHLFTFSATWPVHQGWQRCCEARKTHPARNRLEGYQTMNEQASKSITTSLSSTVQRSVQPADLLDNDDRKCQEVLSIFPEVWKLSVTAAPFRYRL